MSSGTKIDPSMIDGKLVIDATAVGNTVILTFNDGTQTQFKAITDIASAKTVQNVTLSG